MIQPWTDFSGDRGGPQPSQNFEILLIFAQKKYNVGILKQTNITLDPPIKFT